MLRPANYPRCAVRCCPHEDNNNEHPLPPDISHGVRCGGISLCFTSIGASGEVSIPDCGDNGRDLARF